MKKFCLIALLTSSIGLSLKAANEEINMCTEYAVNFSKPQGVSAAEETYHRHMSGIEIPEANFAGPGICFQVPVTSPLSDLESFQKLSMSVSGVTSHLVKIEQKHTILFNTGYQFQSPEACRKNIENHKKYLESLIAVSTLNSYQDGKYYLQLPSFDLPEVREIRMTQDQKGITVLAYGGYLTSNTYCYFSIR